MLVLERICCLHCHWGVACLLLSDTLGFKYNCLAGAKTGRSPRDKRVVREAESENDIWWNQDKNGSPNFEMDERSAMQDECVLP